MKKTILLMVGLVCGFMMLFGAATSTQAFSLSVQSNGTASSPSADVWLLDRGTTQIGSYDIFITYDSLILAFNNAVFGNYLGGPQDSSPGIDLNNMTVEAYEISFLNPLPTQPNNFILFTLTFDAIGTGTSLLKFDSVILGDANGDEINTFELINGSVDVNPVPEPNTLLLLCAGLGSLFVWRGRFAADP